MKKRKGNKMCMGSEAVDLLTKKTSDICQNLALVPVYSSHIQRSTAGCPTQNTLSSTEECCKHLRLEGNWWVLRTALGSSTYTHSYM